MRRKIKIIVCVVILLLVGVIGVIVLGRNTKNEENVNDLNNDIIQNISSIDDIYNSEITKDYTDIRVLSKDYSKEKAQQDNCFVIGAMVHNDNLYSEFMTDFNENKSLLFTVQ